MTGAMKMDTNDLKWFPTAARPLCKARPAEAEVRVNVGEVSFVPQGPLRAGGVHHLCCQMITAGLQVRTLLHDVFVPKSGMSKYENITYEGSLSTISKLIFAYPHVDVIPFNI